MDQSMSNQPKLTRRMRWIVQRMKDHGAIIQEYRDPFQEKTRWQLEWQIDTPTGIRYHEVEVTERMRCKLIEAKLIKHVESKPVYTKGGKFVTTESVYGLGTEEKKQ